MSSSARRPSSSNGSIGSALAPSISPTSSSKASLHSPFASIFIRIGKQQFLVPIAEVLSYHALFNMVQKLNTQRRIFEGDNAFRVFIEDNGEKGAVVLERFWDKIVRDGLKIYIEYNLGDNLPALSLDKSLQSGLGTTRDADDSFYPHSNN